MLVECVRVRIYESGILCVMSLSLSKGSDVLYVFPCEMKEFFDFFSDGFCSFFVRCFALVLLIEYFVWIGNVEDGMIDFEILFGLFLLCVLPHMCNLVSFLYL